MTDYQKTLMELIDGHCAAMKAQVLDRNVKLEYLDDPPAGLWVSSGGLFLLNERMVGAARWTRLAPITKEVK